MRKRINLAALMGVCMAVGSAILGFSHWYMTSNEREFLARSQPAKGVITGHWCRRHKRLKTDPRHTERTDSKHGCTYAPVVRFRTRDGVEKEGIAHVSTRPPEGAPGDVVRLRYDPARPREIRIDGAGRGLIRAFGLASLAFGAIAVLLLAIGIVPAVRRRLRALRATRIEATIVGVSISDRVVNSRHPFHLEAEAYVVVEGVPVHCRFRSPELWLNPEQYLETKTIDVSLYGGKPDRYDMDLSFLPDEAFRRP